MTANDPRIDAGMRCQAELRREQTDGAALIGWKAGLNAPGPPTNGRAITRPTFLACSIGARSRHSPISRSSPNASSCAAICSTESTDV